MGGEKVDYHAVSNYKKSEDEPQAIQAPKGFGYRHVQVLILFLTLSFSYGIRAHLSVTMVSMTGGINTAEKNCECHPHISSLEKTQPFSTNTSEFIATGTVIEDIYDRPDDGFSTSTEGTIEEKVSDDDFKQRSIKICKCDHNERKSSNITKWSVMNTYDWDKATQDTIMSAFFVGYTSMMIPMGILTQKIGAKVPLMIALGSNGILSILTPWVPIFGGWMGVCIIRMLNGMTQAALFPCIHTVLAKWSPLSERGRLSAYIYTGSQFGTIFVFQIAGFFAGNSSFGWPFTFWAIGALNLLMFGMVMWLGASTPHEHKKISFKELKFITGDLSASKPKARKTPWKRILTSKAVWGLVTAQIGSAMGYILVYTQTPTYMSKVLGMDIKKIGIYSSLPYIALYVMILSNGYLTDFLINRKIMSVVNVRRMNNTFGMVVSPLFLIAFGLVNNTLVAVILQILCLAFHAGCNHGFHINQIDLAPNFAGSIMALGNMISNLFGLLVPVIVVNIVQNDLGNQTRWQLVFIILGVIQILLNLVFVIFVKGTAQEWNNIEDDDEDAVVEKYLMVEKKPPTEEIYKEKKNLHIL